MHFGYFGSSFKRCSWCEQEDPSAAHRVVFMEQNWKLIPRVRKYLPNSILFCFFYHFCCLLICHYLNLLDSLSMYVSR